MNKASLLAALILLIHQPSVAQKKTPAKEKPAAATEMKIPMTADRNGRLAFADKNLYIAPIRKEPDGRCSIDHASFKLPLKAGDNELLIGVSNDFYGWGIIARLDTMEGIGCTP